MLIVSVLVAGSLGLTACSSSANKTDTEKAQTAALDNSLDNNRNRDYWPTDDWKVSNPEEEGIDTEKLEVAKNRMSTEISSITSFLIVKNGFLICEEYFNNYEAGDTQDIKSITKSILSILTGIAIDEGYIIDEKQTLVDIFPEYAQLMMDPLTKEITIEHLLTMSSGLQDTSKDVQVGKRQEDYSDLVKTLILDLPVVNNPGSSFLYDEGHIHILSGIITTVSKMSTLEFAEKYLFSPLGITNAKWATDPNGLCYGGSGLQITSKDLAKIGYLYLNDGMWDDQQIVSKEWIKKSVKPRFDVQDQQVIIGETEYGYLWWLCDLKGHPAFIASGRGGQFIFVIPDLDMVIVITADGDANAGPQFFVPFKVVEDNIMDAVIEK
jgi:CubicO group peptidase (beta-lactamase class C family)